MIAELIGSDDGITIAFALTLAVIVVAFVRRETTNAHTIQSLTEAGKAQAACNQQQQRINEATNLRLDRLERPEREETSVRASRTGRFPTIEERDR